MRMLRSSSVVFFFTAVLAATLVGPGPVRAAAPLLEKIHLFEEKTDGFVSYRIPGLVVTAKGTVLVF
jgi:sialidase-1